MEKLTQFLSAVCQKHVILVSFYPIKKTLAEKRVPD